MSVSSSASCITPRLDLPRTDPNEFIRIGGLLIGLIIVFVFGLLDDKFEFRPGLQFVAQVIASIVAIASLIIIERFNNPFTNQQVNLSEIAPWLIVPLSLFWLMGMMNTVNWLDGLDGLAAGIAAIFSAVLFVAMMQDTATQDPQLSIAPLPLALLGATLGFLPYNFYPARVFMGSSGALTLGFALGCLGIIGGAKMATVLLVLAVPIIDVAWLIVSRIRHGKSPFQGGRDHLHFRLLDLGLSQRQIVIGYYLISALFGALALIDRSAHLQGAGAGRIGHRHADRAGCGRQAERAPGANEEVTRYGTCRSSRRSALLLLGRVIDRRSIFDTPAQRAARRRFEQEDDHDERHIDDQRDGERRGQPAQHSDRRPCPPLRWPSSNRTRSPATTAAG